MSLAIGAAILLVTVLLIYSLVIFYRRPAAVSDGEGAWLSNLILPALTAGLAFGIGFVITGIRASPQSTEVAIVGAEAVLFTGAWILMSMLYRRLKAKWQTPELPQPRPLRNGAIAGKRTKRSLRRAA